MSQFDVSKPSLGTVIMPIFAFSGHSTARGVSAVNPAVDRRTKHIEIRYHYIREFYESGETDIFYVASEDQLADQLTKNVPFSSIEKFRSSTGMVSTP